MKTGGGVRGTGAASSNAVNSKGFNGKFPDCAYRSRTSGVMQAGGFEAKERALAAGGRRTMGEGKGTLHLVCGKIAAGKSTLCARLAAAPGTVAIGEDFWLKRLFGDEMKDVADYVRVAAKLRGPMGEHVADLLRAGVDVVLDFPANTKATRAWMKGIADAAAARAILHWLDVPDETCRARLRRRNEEGEHDFAGVTDEQFDLITAYFQPPDPAEGLEIVKEEG
jgi:predicted kinase